jgi:hypothetical protein
LRDHAGRIDEANRFGSPGGLVDALVVDPRRPHRHHARRRGHLPRLLIPITDHQPVTLRIELVDVSGRVGGDLRGQRRGQHPPSTIAHDLIEQRLPGRQAAAVGAGLIVDYLEHRRTFPNQRANAGPDQNNETSDHPPGRFVPP